MQIGETKVMGTINNNCIGIGNVDTILYDGSRKQHVVVVIGEVKHDLFQFLGLHLSMSDGDAGIGDILMNHLFDMRQVTDAVVNEVNLSVARHLEVDGIGDNLCTKGMYLCLNGITVGRWCLDDTQVAGADK